MIAEKIENDKEHMSLKFLEASGMKKFKIFEKKIELMLPEDSFYQMPPVSFPFKIFFFYYIF